MTENSKVTVPQALAEGTDWTYDAYPRLREYSRFEAMKAGDVTTTYEQIGDATERITWTNPKGEGFVWVQTWPCPLNEAPKLGESYLVTHDEWFIDGECTRIIHAFTIQPAPDPDGDQ